MNGVIGLDLSLTGSGVAVLRPGSWAFKPHTERITTKPAPISERTANIRARRISRIIAEIEADVRFYRPSLAVVESPVPNRRMKSGMLLERGALYWGTLAMLDRFGVEIVECAPKQRALYATGNGAADKVSVVERMVAEWNIDTRDDNEIDALVLAAIGCRIVGLPVDEPTEYRRKVAAELAANRKKEIA